VTEDERRILGHVLAGQTDSQIIEAWLDDDRKREADVVGFVARMTQALLGRGKPTTEPGTGRHRRDP
jgi:hypothetical protein